MTEIVGKNGEEAAIRANLLCYLESSIPNRRFFPHH
jgi:hypothetical protein